MEFNIKNCVGKKVTIHCKTTKEAVNFYNVLHEEGVFENNKRQSDKILDYILFADDDEEFYYGFDTDGQSCCPKCFYLAMGYTILDWGEFMEAELTK